MAWVVERFGRFDRVLDPGLRFLIPWVQKISYVFSLKEDAISVPSQTAIVSCRLAQLDCCAAASEPCFTARADQRQREHLN